MLLRRFTDFVLQRRAYAMGTAFVLSIVPLGASISILIAALVTLRKGAFEGTWVLAAALAPFLLGYVLSSEQSQVVLVATVTVLVVNILTWLLAVILRQYPRWSVVLETAAFIGIVLICMIHWMFPAVQDWWMVQLTAYLNKTTAMLGSLAANDTGTTEQVRVLATNAKQYIVGFIIASLIFNAVLQLLVARWWQAAMFNPGGLRKELYQIRLSYISAAVFIAIIGLAYSGNALGIDLLPIMVTVFCIAGLSVIHNVFAHKNAGWFWIVLVYLCIIFIFPMGIAIVALLGLSDSVLDLRQRFIK